MGKGFRYNRCDFIINDFLEYAYNDHSIMLKCTDSVNNLKYLTSYEVKRFSSVENPLISFREIRQTDYQKMGKDYHIVKLDKDTGEWLNFLKYVSLFIAILCLFSIIKRIKKIG